jgi:hypothetical protein
MLTSIKSHAIKRMLTVAEAASENTEREEENPLYASHHDITTQTSSTQKYPLQRTRMNHQLTPHGD